MKITPVVVQNGITFGIDTNNVLYWMTDFGSWCPVTEEQANSLKPPEVS